MTMLNRYLLPLVAAALIAVGVGSLWDYLLPFATNDWGKVLIYISMCVLAVAGMIAVQVALPREHRPQVAGRDVAHLGSSHSAARRAH